MSAGADAPGGTGAWEDRGAGREWCATTVPPERGGRVPKIGHLVLYKLAGFCHADTPP